MLEGLKRWLSGASNPSADDDVAAWAEQRQFALRVVKDEGFVVDGRTGSFEWRLEWGPSQRPYIAGHELRLRADLGLPAELQAVLLTRPLQERLEQAMFEQYVEDVQTRIDDATPPEMRWLVMYPKLPVAALGALRDHYAVAGSSRAWLSAWLAGPLAESLRSNAPSPERPLVLTIGRGRLTLRTAVEHPEVPVLKTWLRVFETALREARRVADESVDGVDSAAAQGSAFDPAASPPDDTSRP